MKNVEPVETTKIQAQTPEMKQERKQALTPEIKQEKKSVMFAEQTPEDIIISKKNRKKYV